MFQSDHKSLPRMVEKSMFEFKRRSARPAMRWINSQAALPAFVDKSCAGEPPVKIGGQQTPSLNVRCLRRADSRSRRRADIADPDDGRHSSGDSGFPLITWTGTRVVGVIAH